MDPVRCGFGTSFKWKIRAGIFTDSGDFAFGKILVESPTKSKGLPQKIRTLGKIRGFVGDLLKKNKTKPPHPQKSPKV